MRKTCPGGPSSFSRSIEKPRRILVLTGLWTTRSTVGNRAFGRRSCLAGVLQALFANT
ncbi:hypothetical protein HMPREF9440_01248 [Sutterella parvirubra YIT 11816]|uniref:Uncharacterized protein n=1 Tax=Sutterella parvirubra YIT 11816 TaxID=762967 RepID=H3KET3_9BURK|nr:hypothetical protein HMPREF9440_01248 [Sutterella parvirubra YIT 11816]